MGSLATVAIVVFLISFMVFVTFFGRLPALRNTPIASLHTFIWVHLPNGLLALDNKVTGGRFSSWLSRFVKHMVHDRHPTILIFFFLLMCISEFLYLPTAWPQLNRTQKAAGAVAMALPYIFLYLASFGDPGYVSAENLDYYLALYPYDFSIFHPGVECRTCRILKPARSKHCSICKRCVARSDHHCIFINKCVGYRNHRWFMLLLLSTAILTSYGGFLGVSLMSTKIKARFPEWTLWPPKGLTWSRYLVIWGWALQSQVAMGSVTLLIGMLTPMIWGFFGYTVYILYCGMTTNESMKWSDWKEEMRDGYAYRRTMPLNRRKDPRFEAQNSRWPLDTEQILVMTESGQLPSNPNIPGEGHWEKVWKLKDVDNLYDLGMWHNTIDVLRLDHPFSSGRGELPPVGRRAWKRKSASTSLW